MTRSRAALALVGYAITLVVGRVFGLVERVVIDSTHGSHGEIHWILELGGYLWIGLAVAGAIALFQAARLPRSSGARDHVRRAAILLGVLAAFMVVERFAWPLTRSASAEHIELWFKIIEIVFALLYAGVDVSFGLGLLALGRATQSRAMKPLVIVGLVVAALHVLACFVPHDDGGWFGTVTTAAHYLGAVAFVAGCGLGATLVARLEPDPARGASPYRDGALPGDEERIPLDPRWRAPAAGISIYLGAAAVRVLAALLSFAVTSSMNASDYGALHQTHDALLMVSFLSGGATLGMLFGVLRISQAPYDTGAREPAGLALIAMILGALVELYTTWLTLQALGGSVSAAFSAMDAIPWLLAMTATFGVGAAWGLSRAIAALAKRLALEDAERSARSVGPLVSVAAALVVVAFVAKAPTEALIAVLVVALPIAIVVLFKFLGAALAVLRKIRAELDAEAP